MLYGQRDEFGLATRTLDAALVRNPALYEPNLYRYNWLRQRGIIEIRQHNYRGALPYFTDALRIVQALGQDRMIATVQNDLGTIHRELGYYTESLSAFERALDQYLSQPIDYRTGLTQANIAAVYRDMGNLEDALLYLERALASHEASLSSDPANDGWISGFIAHVHEDTAATLVDMGRGEQAEPHLSASLRLYTVAGRTAEQARVKVLQARLDADRGRPEAALSHLLEAQQLEAQLESTAVIELRPVLAEVLLQLGRYDEAETAAVDGLAITREAQQRKLSMSLLETLTKIHEANQRPDLALNVMRQFIELRERLLQEQYDRDFAVLRSNIEIDEQRRANALLERDNQIAVLALNRQRVLLLAAALSIVLLGVVVAWIWRQKRADTCRLRTEIAHHRDELDQMVKSSRRQLAILDKTNEPLACFDESGRIVYHNRMFAQWLANEDASMVDQALGNLLPELFQVVSEALADGEANAGGTLIDDMAVTVDGDERRFAVWLSRLDHRDGFHVIVIQAYSDQPVQDSAKDTARLRKQLTDLRRFQELSPRLLESLGQLSESGSTDLARLLNDLDALNSSQLERAVSDQSTESTEYQQALVSLMLAAVETWEESTGLTTIDLAEKSGIWLVAIDDGRLRTRTMEKYLTVQRLPRRPRWRQVVRTCRYVLIHCKLSAERRERLNALLERFLKLERDRAISG
jgi:tetratricopeptide (TPR) repeat protein